MIERKRPTHCYIGRCEGCGAVEASTYDLRNKDTGESVADMISCGLIVERVEFKPGAIVFSACTCPKPPVVAQAALEL